MFMDAFYRSRYSIQHNKKLRITKKIITKITPLNVMKKIRCRVNLSSIEFDMMLFKNTMEKKSDKAFNRLSYIKAK